jgi:hypothetical protein
MVLCAYLLIPDQSGTALGVELIVTGALVWALLMAIVIPAVRTPTRQPVSWRVVRVLTLQFAMVPVVLAGCAVLGWPPGGLNWLSGSVLFTLCAATSNAWVLLVEVVRDERYLPVDDVHAP